MIDAIGRTLYRLFVSHRKLLEWTTAAQARERARLELRAFVWPHGAAHRRALAVLRRSSRARPASARLAAAARCGWSLAAVARCAEHAADAPATALTN